MDKKPSKYSRWSGRVFSVSILLFLSFNSFSQKEANNWYFGVGAGITFNTDPPSALQNGQMFANEGSASISDQNGRLLFYTDGLKVWDSSHSLTPNGFGLQGNVSSTQSAIIVPFPGNSKLYYIFTVEAQGGNNGLNFSIFDMDLNSGKGDIDPNQKNINLLKNTCEKVTAVRHSNGKDYWILTHKHNSDLIYAWSISSSGINFLPVISKTGLKINSAPFSAIGYMKVSPDGSKIAYANHLLDACGIGDFNTKTGLVSNVWDFELDAYGVEFSSNSKYLYISETDKFTIYQFDAKSISKTNFEASKKLIYKYAESQGIGALQIGPDRKIYISNCTTRYLDVINSPDSAGNSCGFQGRYINLLGRSCTWGLPSFNQSLFKPGIRYKNSCYNDTSWFFINENIVDSVKWEFGDTASKNKNIARGTRVYHLFSDTGVYKVQSVVFKGKYRDTSVLEILQTSPKFTLGKDTFVCDKKFITLGYFKDSFEKYQWNNNSSSPGLLINSPGFYTLKITDKLGCSKTDSINVLSFKMPKIKLGNDTVICNNTAFLDAKNNPLTDTYKWKTSDSTKIIAVHQSGMYWVNVSNSCGSASDTIQLKLLSKPYIVLPNDTLICDRASFVLDASDADSNSNYLWLSGEKTPALAATKSGKYSVTVTNHCGLGMDSVNLVFYKTPIANLKPDFVFCDTMSPVSRTINLASKQDTYEWSNGGKDTIQTFTIPGKYWVTIKNICGEVSDTVSFKISKNPKVDLGRDTSLCGNGNLLLDAGNPGMLYNWHPGREKTKTVIAREKTIYTVIVSNKDGCFGQDSIRIFDSCVSRYWFPNSFSPNADLINETFKPSLTNCKNYEMRIYNRWGEMIFETKDMEYGWDGTYKGLACQSGVYFFVSNFVIMESGIDQFVKGTITLVK